MRAPPIAREPVAIVAIGIAGTHVVACAIALAFGFDHVSDDDFARVTIAQTFAVAPKLDPSGTSWLPFPFWWLGTTLAIFGRSLVVARAASVAFASAAFAAPYLAMRFIGVTPRRAIVAAALMLLGAWTLWLGASTVPESFTASFTVAGAIALGARADLGGDRRRALTRLLFAGGILAACLSRYETWPVAAILAAVDGARLLRRPAATLAADRPAPPSTVAANPSGDTLRSRAHVRATNAVVLVLLVLGPLVWMAWNAHAHDGPLHFFRRVSNFKRAIGEGATDTVDALLLYPRLLVTTRPEIVLAAAVAIPALRAPAMRARWLVPLGCAAAQVAFLAYGNVRDGAPAHHAERALLATNMLLAAFAADAGLETLRGLRANARAVPALALAIVSIAWTVSLARGLADPPGRTEAEDRRAQLERGSALRAVPAASIVVTPCAYEHFALLAAYGAPERAQIQPSLHLPVSPDCPRIGSLPR